MLFAARWWLPVFLVLFFLPRWVSQVGGSKKLGWLAAGLFVVAPATAWWSMSPLTCVAYAIAGSSIMISGYRRLQAGRRVSGATLLLVAAIFLASLPSFYIPWVLILSTPVLLVTMARILTDKAGLAYRLVSVFLTGILAVALAAGTYLEGAKGLTSMLGTVYPGSRRSAAAAEPLGNIFGAPALGPLQSADPVGTNASELSTAFAICFVWAIALLVSRRIHRPWREKLPVWIFGVWATIWLLWITLDFGPSGAKIPLMNLIPPSRANQVFGYVAVLLLVLVLSKVSRIGWRLALSTAAVSAGITAYAASLLRQTELPTQTSAGVILAAGGVFVAVLLVTRYRTKALAVVAALVIATIPIAKVNPIMFGLGDLRNSPTAKALYTAGTQARADNKLWASNVGNMDVVMVANGVPTLSGLQRSGPNLNEWHKLDPGGVFKNSWNRGGGYLSFVWTPNRPTEISDNGFDVTFVRIDPCTLAKAEPNLSHIVSDTPLNLPCLGSQSTLKWSGQELLVYEIK